MSRQLALDLPVRTALGREEFFVAPSNATALAEVDRWRGWPRGRLVLEGPAGAGKTHLASVWAAETGAAILNAAELSTEGLDAHLSAPALVVEDADRPGIDEAALFHLVNMAEAAGRPLLLTARNAPSAWPTALPDLRSRMMGSGLARLGAPDDALLRAVLLKLFADRQLRVPPALVDYLLARMDRSFAAARALVAALDAEALALGRPLTTALAARVLDKDGTPGP